MEVPFTDPVLIFSTILAAILLAPLLFTRFRLPGIVGIIVVGVLVGPNALGLLEVEGTVALLGQVGRREPGFPGTTDATAPVSPTEP